VYRVLVRKQEGRTPLGRPRRRWAGQVARMVEVSGCIGSCWGNRREGDHWGDLGVDGLGMWHVWVRRGCV